MLIKADYIDHSHARNIVSARIWSEIVESRSDYSELPLELRESPNNWETDGFPVKLTVNEVYQGVYTLNIPKDAWMFNMDEDNVNHAVLCAELNNGDLETTNTQKLACEFRANAEINGGDWSLEFPDTLRPEIKTSFNNLINFVMSSTDAQFKYGISNYLDIQSAIDYYIYAYFGGFIDSLGKNLIMATVDGTKWYASMYDMDSTWGLFYTGTQFLSPTMSCPENYQETNSLLWQRIETVFATEIKNRYSQLRESVLTLENISRKFKSFMDIIGSELYEQDLDAYPSIPLGDRDHLQQVIDFVTERAAYVDAEIEALEETEYSDIPVTAVTLDSKTMTLANSSIDGLKVLDNAQNGLYAGMEIYQSTECSTPNTNSILSGLFEMNDTDEYMYIATCIAGEEINQRFGFYQDGILRITLKLSDALGSFNNQMSDGDNGFKVMSVSSDGNSAIDTIKILKISKDYIAKNVKDLEANLVPEGTGDVVAPISSNQGDIVIMQCVSGTWNGLQVVGEVSAISNTNNNTGKLVAANVPDGITIGIKVNGTQYANGNIPKYMVISQADLRVSEGVLAATIIPEGATTQTVTWKSSNPTVATVDADGLKAKIKAVSSGKCAITCTSDDTTNGYISDSCNVTVN